jgi:hypothetical protein
VFCIAAAGAFLRGLRTGRRAFLALQTVQARRAFVGELEAKFNKLDGAPSRNFRSFLSLPAFEIGTQNEKLPANLDNANLFFLNDSAEMPYGKACQTGGVGNIEKHPFRGT